LRPCGDVESTFKNLAPVLVSIMVRSWFDAARLGSRRGPISEAWVRSRQNAAMFRMDPPPLRGTCHNNGICLLVLMYCFLVVVVVGGGVWISARLARLGGMRMGFPSASVLGRDSS